MIGVAFALRGTFGTSTDIECSAFIRVLLEFRRLRGLEVDAPEAVSTTLGKGELSSESSLRATFSTALRPYLLQQGDAVQLDEMFRIEAARLMLERFVALDDVARTLGELASLNVPCVGLSGGSPSVDSCKAELAGFTSPIIFAGDLGVDGSAPTVFARVCRTLSLPADRIWFVGTDARAEIIPAAAAGLRTIWLNRESETFPPNRIAPDATVSSLVEILDVLSAPYTRGLLALRDILSSALDWRLENVVSEDDMPSAPE